ncbi:MAG: CpsD/CapB family tyrosine-protein kinase [Candidatus Omnitrophota bacterium]
MGKITDALKKAAQEKMERLEKLDRQDEVKYEFVAKKVLDSKVDPRIVSFHDPKSTVAEQYRSLRTNIQALSAKNPVKALTITSSVHNEGKTITAINLAISMARDLNKKSILLADGDLRRATLSKYLGLKTQVGLADLIQNGADVNDALINIGIENLTILTAGKIPHNPAELLGSQTFKNLMNLFKKKYDYIIFDSPPVISVTDAGLLGAETDGAIMVIKANHTQKGIVEHADDLLKKAHVKLLGYILTNIQYHIPAYIYRYL